MPDCRCGILDWRALRVALGLTLDGMAELLSMSVSGVRYLEREPHSCPRLSTRRFLESALDEPELRGRLAEAGYPHPFADRPAADEAAVDAAMRRLLGLIGESQG